MAAAKASLAGQTLLCAPNGSATVSINVIHLVRFTTNGTIGSSYTTSGFSFYTANAGTSCTWSAGIYDTAGNLKAGSVTGKTTYAGQNYSGISTGPLVKNTDYYAALLFSGTTGPAVTGLTIADAGVQSYIGTMTGSLGNGTGLCLAIAGSSFPSTITLTSALLSAAQVYPLINIY